MVNALIVRFFNFMVVFNIITIFPKIFDSFLKESFIRRAQEKKLIQINIYNLRDFAEKKKDNFN